jgi:chromosome segregation ATPase
MTELLIQNMLKNSIETNQSAIKVKNDTRNRLNEKISKLRKQKILIEKEMDVLKDEFADASDCIHAIETVIKIQKQNLPESGS